MSDVWIVPAGLVPYEQAAEMQKRLEKARQAELIPDVLLALEHPPVYTKGRRTKPGELPMGEDWYRMQGIEVCESDRGGLATYHGPGQLVAYPIASLRPYGDDVHRFVRGIERVMIETLGRLGVEAECVEGLTGVWTAGRKIGSIGLHVNRGVTTHGLAINVNNDLQPFEWIVPCGIEGVQMTSVCRELGEQVDFAAAAELLAGCYGEVFDRTPTPVTAAELGERVPGLGALPAAERAAVGWLR
jgi:lipoate-protein ligase B